MRPSDRMVVLVNDEVASMFVVVAIVEFAKLADVQSGSKPRLRSRDARE